MCSTAKSQIQCQADWLGTVWQIPMVLTIDGWPHSRCCTICTTIGQVHHCGCAVHSLGWRSSREQPTQQVLERAGREKAIDKHPRFLIVTPMANAGRRRLILCFDGTWNTPENYTNVSRLYAAVADLHSGCAEQLKFYDTGVGTQFGSIIRGGAVGVGLSKNILQGYAWLVRQYECGPSAKVAVPDGEQFDNGDEIFLFGFRRGTFTARSLAGLINRCGILKREAVTRE